MIDWIFVHEQKELISGVIHKTKTGKIASKKHNGGGGGGVSDAKKTQLFPQKVILLATI